MKKKSKKNVQNSIIPISLIAVFAVVFYFGFTTFASAKDIKSKYSIENNTESIELAIESYLNSSSNDTSYDIKTENTLELDNKKFILFSFSNKLGFAEVSIGENGLLGIDYANFSDNIVKLNVTSTDSGRYLIAFGRNYDNKINKLVITFDSSNIELSVPDNDFFISYTKLDTNIPSDSQSTVDMYDSFGREITVDMYMKHDSNISK